MNPITGRIRLLLIPIVALLAGCERPEQPVLPPLPTSFGDQLAAPRINGALPAPTAPLPDVAYGTNRPAGSPGRVAEVGTGDFSLDFADTDVREVVAQILGGLLHKTYTIDPAVHGTVTLHTAQPVSVQQLLPTLQTLLASSGAILVPSEGLYRIIPAASAGAAASAVIPLQYVSADELAKVLQPIVGTSTKIAAESGLNALLVSGDPAQIEAVRDLVRSFDDNSLAHQSYVLLPVSAGSARDFADAMQEAFSGKAGGSLAGLVRVVPLARLNIVLIISSQPRYIEAARRVYALVERQRRTTVRSWHVFYLQTSNANDIAYTLQMAFTPNNVTAQPEQQPNSGGSSGGGRSSSGGGGFGQGGGGGLGGASGGGGSGGLGSGGIGTSGQGGLSGASGLGSGSVGGSNPTAPSGGTSGNSRSGSAAPSSGANPLLGGLDQSSGQSNADDMRILPNPQNNAVLIFATPAEEDSVIGMLHKIDIMPMQVRIDATIAEVTLNDSLQYGTQFFFKSGGINGILNNGTVNTVGSPAAIGLSPTFPGFLLGGSGLGGAPLAISALQAVTTVNVLSSPQLTVVDNQQARLQVGALVPYLTGNSQSTLSANAPIINSISYQPTGVIMEVTPRVNSGGLITLDISQEVSDVNPAPSANGILSPTFDERSVTSRVVVQDGQTIGMAGLIRDSASHGNQGIPWLKDIPILGALAGTQNNERVRTELLVLITPHVIRDQNDIRKLSEDMREALSHAAAVPVVVQTERVSGSSDPNRRLREKLQRGVERQPGP